MASRADTVGVFQIESRAQMAMLPRLRPRHFYDLVVQISIVRPGPITGGMVHPYLRRRSGEEPVEYPHPSLVPVLESTLGVPLFQEQVMRLAVVAADYTPGEADQLRRDMAAWRRSGRIERHRDLLMTRMQAKGIAPEFAERVFNQIRGFGDYGFPQCVTAETRVIDAATGRRIAIGEVARGRARLHSTWACGADLRLRVRRVLGAAASGRRPVFHLRTAHGRSVTATADHPVLTPDGWRPLGALHPGDAVGAAAPARVEAHGREPEVSWDRVTAIAPRGIQDTYDLHVDEDHNFLANDLIVHNSHAASFALIAYATAYLKCHFPAEFTCALLNAQPMGFYSPATIIEDAKRHGITVRPVEIRHSAWECTLEPCPDLPGEFAVRVGLRYVHGLGEQDGERLVRARAVMPFASLDDCVSGPGSTGGVRRARGGGRARRVRVRSADGALAGPRALAPAGYPALAGHPRAQSRARSPDTRRRDLLGLPRHRSQSPRASAGIPPRRTPGRRAARRARRECAPERPARPVAGLVICRQTPGTASGVTFMTLEDETGFVNLVVWERVFEQFVTLAKTAVFLGVSGTIQRQDDVVHIIAKTLWAPQVRRGPTALRSRDFH